MKSETKIIFLISFIFLITFNHNIQSQTISNSFSVVQQVPIGGSSPFYVSISGAPADAVITNVQARFDYIAYNGAQSYVSARFNRGSDPGTSGGAVLVSQGSLPSGNPGSYNWISFSNWNGNSVNTSYYFRFNVASGSPYTATINTIYVQVTYAVPLNPPALSSPGDGATLYYASFPAQVSLQWQSVSGATGYDLSVDGNLVSNISATSYSATLNGPGGHTWMARTRNAAGYGSWSSSRSFTFAYSTLNPPALSSPSDGATLYYSSFPAQVSLQWQSVTGATGYDLSVDGNLVSNISATSYSATLSGPGGHTWMARTKNAAGYGSWSSSRSFTFAYSTLNPPVLTSPSDGATLYYASFPAQVSLQWQSVTGATGYDLSVDGNLVSNISGTSYSATLGGPGGHTWMARTRNAAGYGSWSSSRSFTFAYSTLNPPVLSSPGDGATLYYASFPAQVSLQWQSVTGATGYDLSVDGNLVLDISAGSTSYSATLGGPGSHTWMARTKNAAGYGSWSSSRSFTFAYSTLIPPVLSSPSDGATLYYASFPAQVSLQWQSVTGATGYDLSVDGNLVLDISSSSTSYSATLGGPGSHTWMARTKNAAGYGSWSSSRNFTFAVTPLHLISPSQDQEITANEINFSWSDIGAYRYELIVDNNSALGSPEVSKQHIDTLKNYKGTSFLLTGNWLCENVYYWKVIAFSSNGSKIDSSTGSFIYSPDKKTITWVPIYRSYYASDVDHFYCTSQSHLQTAKKGGYIFEKIEGYAALYPFNAGSDLRYLYRFYATEDKSHYYTTNDVDRDNTIINHPKWRYEGITGFCFGSSHIGLTKMYYVYLDNADTSKRDHFYTISKIERDNAIARGYQDKGVIGYVSLSDDNSIQSWPEFQPGFGSGINPQNGNFNHYAKTSFSIPGGRMSLDFAHVYNSYATRLISPQMPLGPGWSHTYNSYIMETDSSILVFWQDGNINLYNKFTLKPVTLGVYDILNRNSDIQFTITKKDQTVFTFEKKTGAVPDDPALLRSIKDRNNNSIVCGYDNSLRITSVTSPDGRSLQFSYCTEENKTHLIQQIADPKSRAVKFEYDADGNLTKYTDAENQPTQYSYDTSSRQDHLLNKITFPRGTFISNTYDSKKVTSQSNGLGSLQISYDQSLLKSNLVDESGKAFEYLYTSQIEGLISKITSASANTQFFYENALNPTKPTKLIDGNGYTTTINYDSRGNELEIDKPLGIIHKFTYDAANNPLKYVNPNNKTTNYTYDTKGNLIQIQDPRGTRIISYLSNGLIQSVKDPLNQTTTLGYNAYGNVSGITDNLFHATSFTYDNVSRLLSSTNALYQSTYYTYDNNDNVKTIKDHANAVTSYNYDPNDNLSNIINAKSQTTSFVYNNNNDQLYSKSNALSLSTLYTYNLNGQIASKSNPNSQTTNYSYDADGRINSISYPSFNASFIYDNNGNILNITGNEALSFNYDAANRITSNTDAGGNTISYGYDPVGNITSITYPGNKTVTYSYYDDNRLKSVTDLNNKITSYSYRDDGTLLSVQYPNGTYTTYNYDNASRVTGLTNTKSNGNVINSYTYQLNEIGNHTQVTQTEPLPYPDLSDKSLTFQYDNANRLISSGNTSFSYDNNGNLIGKNDGILTAYSYDAENRLTGISGSANTTFTYDIYGNRRTANRNGNITRYVTDINSSLSRVLMEKDGNNNVVCYYIYGLGLIERMKPDNSARYYHSDYRGSVIAVTDDNQNITHKYLYSSFGEVLNKVEADYNPFRYIGSLGVMSETDNLYYMRARYYDATTGRFLSEDPVFDNNLYPYANNNPNIKIDPKGTMTDWVYEHTSWADDKNIILAAQLGKVGFTFALEILVPGGGAIATGINAIPLVYGMFTNELTYEDAMDEIVQLSIPMVCDQLATNVAFKTSGIDFIHTQTWGNQMNSILKGVKIGTDSYYKGKDINKAIQQWKKK